MSIEEILCMIPIIFPFLFVDTILEKLFKKFQAMYLFCYYSSMIQLKDGNGEVNLRSILLCLDSDLHIEDVMRNSLL